MFGAFKRQWQLLIPLLVIGVAALVLLPYSTWVGRKSLSVRVHVIDTEAVQPVTGAEVTIFRGALSPLDGTIAGRKQSDFLPDPKSSETETRVTGSDGRCEFKFKFYAFGSGSLLGHSGKVETSGVWLIITASGRQSTLVPIDQQKVGLRDAGDVSPIVVTVVLNEKCAEK